ncbi:MAG: hypothetical protein OEV42_01745 [Deltaproteobacteria bacterium]|nr:hypothetical protein [Deltaproteobacteria bacterium]
MYKKNNRCFFRVISIISLILFSSLPLGAAEKEKSDPATGEKELASSEKSKAPTLPSTLSAGFLDWKPASISELNFPRDRFGLADWVKLVNEKKIEPKGSLDPEWTPDDELVIDSKVLFQTKSDFMNDVIFPHQVHSWWLSCESCHDTAGGPIFQMQAGANRVLMPEIVAGKWCGRCHGKTAFPLADCKRCHTRSKKIEPTEDMITRGVVVPPQEIAQETMDIIIFNRYQRRRDQAHIPPAQFSHSAHQRDNMACSDCHPSIFIPIAGTNDITMVKNMNGDFCGKCHSGDKDSPLSSWDLTHCKNCHIGLQ